jgi:hypothetical protein
LYVVDGDAAGFGSVREALLKAIAEEVAVEGNDGARGEGADVDLDGAGGF